MSCLHDGIEISEKISLTYQKGAEDSAFLIFWPSG